VLKKSNRKCIFDTYTIPYGISVYSESPIDFSKVPDSPSGTFTFQPESGKGLISPLNA
jgi:hypothetical protein